jgi:hypothetical protein
MAWLNKAVIVWRQATEAENSTNPHQLPPSFLGEGWGGGLFSKEKKIVRKFDHVGIPTDEEQANELYVAATKVWVTSPLAHPYRIEYLRYEADSPVTGPVRDLPHIAFQVDDLERYMAGEEIVLGPFQVSETLRVVFIFKDGAVFEFMENSGETDWFKDATT